MSEEQSYNARYRKGEVTIAQVVYNADRLNYEMIALKERLAALEGALEEIGAWAEEYNADQITMIVDGMIHRD